MKIKTSMRRLKNAQISFISLVSRGANRIPFRTLKSEGENQMLDLTQLRHVFKSEAAPSKPTGKGYANILKANPFRASKTTPEPTPVTKAAPQIAKAPVPRHTVQQAQQHQQVNEERQRQGLAPHQPLHNTPATTPTRRASNTPKQPAPSRDTVTLKELRGEIDNALTRSKKQDAQEQFNAKRSAFSQLSATQEHHVGRGGSGNAHALRMHGGALAASILNSATRKGEHALPSTSAWRPMSGESLKA